jgi:hypothetical protein
MKKQITIEEVLELVNFASVKGSDEVFKKTELQGIDHAAFFAALDQPAQATSALKAAFQRYQSRIKKCDQHRRRCNGAS